MYTTTPAGRDITGWLLIAHMEYILWAYFIPHFLIALTITLILIQELWALSILVNDVDVVFINILDKIISNIFVYTTMEK